MIFKNILLVFLGGGLGSLLRYLLSKSLYPVLSNAILGTFTVNILGSVLIGLLIGLEIKNVLEKPSYLLFVTGFCGGFTTFSAFALENHSLLKNGEYLLAFTYMITSIIIGLIAVGVGFMIAKAL